jgi:hypothetical protein
MKLQLIEEEKKVLEKIRTILSNNEFENWVLAKIISGLTVRKPELQKKVRVRLKHYPLLYEGRRYVQIPTSFGTFNLFPRREFYGASGTTFKPDFLLFKDKLPDSRENPLPDVIIECKSGMEMKESYRGAIFQFFVATIDFFPKLALFVTQYRPKYSIACAEGHEGLLNYYGIRTLNAEDDNIEETIPQLIVNGINAEFTRRRLELRFTVKH